MAMLTMVNSLDLASLDLTFPVGGISTEFGFELFSGSDWRIDVTLHANGRAAKFDLFHDFGAGFEQQLGITGIGLPFAAPIGGTIQSLLSLVLDGKDRLTGTAGADGLSGYKGNDVIFGGRGNDRYFGGQGNDSLTGGSGRDILHGGGGHDSLNGGRGADVLIGGKGDDRLDGSRGRDTFVGGPGSDRFVFENFKDDGSQDKVRDFEIGIDKIEIHRGAKELADLNFTQLGDDVLMTFKQTTIKFLDVTVSELNDDGNFTFWL